MKKLLFAGCVLFLMGCINPQRPQKEMKGLSNPDLTDQEVLRALVKKISEQAETNKQAEDALTGKPAPQFSIEDVHGNLVDLAALKGKVVVLYYWFIDCPLCVLEIRELNKIVQKFKGENVVFIGITFDGNGITGKYLRRRKFDFDIIANARSLFDLYGIKTWPMKIVIGKNGQMVFVKSGEDSQNLDRMVVAIDKALEE